MIKIVPQVKSIKENDENYLEEITSKNQNHLEVT